MKCDESMDLGLGISSCQAGMGALKGWAVLGCAELGLVVVGCAGLGWSGLGRAGLDCVGPCCAELSWVRPL